MAYDAELAAKSVAELAATTDQTMTDDARTALVAVFAAWTAWRVDPQYPRKGTPRGQLMATLEARITAANRELRSLPPDVDLATVVKVAQPILGAAWPSAPEPAAAVATAVDRLRYASLIRPGLVRDAKAVRRWT